ncbi:MAG: hypothetical protein RSB25_06795, partial [Acinetobacter sp.]
ENPCVPSSILGLATIFKKSSNLVWGFFLPAPKPDQHSLLFFSLFNSFFSQFPAFLCIIDRLSNLTIGTGIICKI